MLEITINGVTYEAVDTPITDDTDVSCRDCDIFKAKVPKSITSIPLCCEVGNSRARLSCCNQLAKRIKRTWKRKED